MRRERIRNQRQANSKPAFPVQERYTYRWHPARGWERHGEFCNGRSQGSTVLQHGYNRHLMSTPQERIQADLKTAMKARQPERLATLRMLLTAIKNDQIQRREEVDSDGFIRLLQRSVKQRKEAAEQFRKGDRVELAEKEEREAEILSEYLPQQVGEDEIRQAITELVQSEGMTGLQAMGAIMKAMLSRFGATASGSTISRIAREVLAG